MKVRVESDFIDTRIIEEVEKRCEKCSVCGGNLIIQTAYDGWEKRICCENYEDKFFHGNPDNKRVTNWFSGVNSAEDMIKQWNEING